MPYLSSSICKIASRVIACIGFNLKSSKIKRSVLDLLDHFDIVAFHFCNRDFIHKTTHSKVIEFIYFWTSFSANSASKKTFYATCNTSNENIFCFLDKWAIRYGSSFLIYIKLQIKHFHLIIQIIFVNKNKNNKDSIAMKKTADGGLQTTDELNRENSVLFTFITTSS